MLETLFEERLADIQVDLKALKKKARATVRDIYAVARELTEQHGGRWATLDKMGRAHVKNHQGKTTATVQVISIPTMELLLNLGGFAEKPQGYGRDEYWMVHPK